MKKIIIFYLVLLSVLIGSVYYILNLEQSDTSSKEENHIHVSESVEQTSYVTETKYTGADVPAALYSVPFKKTDSYENNISVQNKLTDNQMQSFMNTAATYCKTVFGNSYINISQDQDAFLNSVTELLYQNSGFQVEEAESTASAYAESLMAFYIDNKVDASVTFQTDKSLIYKDSYMYHVRGALNITVFGDKACKAYEDMFGIALTSGEVTTMMCEISILPDKPDCVFGLHIYYYID